jgi:hypothetical protein
MRLDFTLYAIALVIIGCRESGSERGGDGSGANGGGSSLQAYREIQAINGGTVAGVAELEEDVPRDTMVHPLSDQRVCGERLLDVTVQRRGDRIAQVVVWLDGLRAGKPRPVERRFEVTHRRCAFEPRVQAVLAGGTLNVKSADPVVHRARILAGGSRRTLEVVRQNDAGQVVPVEGVLARPGRIELRCDVHPWTRGWIQVFDHPYFAVTDPDGRFRIDSVPPGDYRLRAWHERLGTAERWVRVVAGREARLEIDLPGVK